MYVPDEGFVASDSNSNHVKEKGDRQRHMTASEPHQRTTSFSISENQTNDPIRISASDRAKMYDESLILLIVYIHNSE